MASTDKMAIIVILAFTAIMVITTITVIRVIRVNTATRAAGKIVAIKAIIPKTQYVHNNECCHYSHLVIKTYTS